MSISLPTCFLHIGMPKTGTSSIQESLGNANLDNWGTYCKVTKSHNQTGAFCTMFLSKPEKFHANVKRSLSLEEITTIRKDYRLSLQDILKKSCKKNLIISAEGLFHVDKDGLDDLLNFISEFYKKVIVICYIRPPASYLSSSFQQTLKSRDVFTLDLEREYPFYRKKLAKFEAVFGKDAINYILFDKKTLKNADVVQDICATIGIDYALINARHTNESLSREASSLLFTYRKQGGLFGTGKEAMLKNKLMIEKLGELRGSKLTFCSDLIQPILNKNADDIAWM